MIDSITDKCTINTHVFSLVELKDGEGNVKRDIPDNMRCRCGKMLYGDIMK